MKDKPVQLKITQTPWTSIEFAVPWGRVRKEWLREQLPTATNLSFAQHCGHTVVYEFADIPMVSTPCPCGHKDCWIVKWGEAERSEP